MQCTQLYILIIFNNRSPVIGVI